MFIEISLGVISLKLREIVYVLLVCFLRRSFYLTYILVTLGEKILQN